MQSEITQFKNGLNSINGFFDAVMMAPDATQNLFVDDNSKVTFHVLKRIYRIDFSPESSNNRRNEDNVIYCLEAFLVDCEGIFYVI